MAAARGEEKRRASRLTPRWFGAARAGPYARPMTTEPEARAAPNPILKLWIDVGPLVVFFVGNARWGIIPATGAFMVATVVSLVASFVLHRRLPVLPLAMAGFVMVFGGLTIILNDEIFIKLKPTIVNTLFGLILLGGVVLKRPLLRPLMGAIFKLTEEGWFKLTVRWAFFFFVLAILNEIVWRNVSTDMWVNFKVFGIMPLTILFSLSQMPLMNRYKPQEDTA